MRSAAVVLLLALSGAASAQQLLCAADLDGDGEIAQNEQATCSTTVAGAYCPLQPTPCVAITNPDGTPGFACPGDSAHPCVPDASGKRCSTQSCFARSDVPAQTEDPPASNPPNSGPRDAVGSCIGELQIFEGESSRCRRAGAATAFQNCCEKHSGAIHDSDGAKGVAAAKLDLLKTIFISAGIATTSGAAAANTYLNRELDPKTVTLDVTDATMVKMLLQRCDSRDIQTALLTDSGYCVTVGDYCAERWPLVGCVQRAEARCCFNSKLARIVQQQGRAQLPAMGGFGTPEEPNCRGFRPEEFQAIDFSKIDLSEYFDDLRPRSQALIEGEIRTSVQEHL